MNITNNLRRNKQMKKQNNDTVDYKALVTRAKEVKEGSVAFDMEVNGVKIYGCWYNEYKNKKGEDGVMLSFPSYKSGDKYYSHCWFPISKELREDIVAQIEKLV
jgi:DNA-binding cell septation regulator SpoVG